MPTTDEKPAEVRAAAALKAAFGSGARWHASAPGRVNLIGEHTDYSGGHVLPIAIDRRCHTVAAVGGEPGAIRVFAADLGERWTVSSDDVRRGVGGIKKGDWRCYAGGVLCLFSEALRMPLPSLDAVIASDVPLGGGLASSAALCVSLATLLEAVVNGRLDPLAKALLCRRVEHEFAGVPCGLMDPAASTLAREGHALLLDCSNETNRSDPAAHASGPVFRHIPFPPPSDAVLLVINTKVRHSLADGGYARRRAACESAACKIGVPWLCRATPGALAGARLTDEERRCAAHAVDEERRVLEAAGSMGRRDFACFGRLMNESHVSLRDLYRVSCPELDTVVAAAGRCPGVYGGRMTGGGFGGCAITLVEPSEADSARGRISGAFAAAFGRDCEVFGVRAEVGAEIHGRNE